MDHHHAEIIEFTADPMSTKKIEDDFGQDEKNESITHGEHHFHNKQQQRASEYHKKLRDVILHYENVLLFGPTNAKQEFSNALRADRTFDKISIEVVNADKMTDNQKHAFVRHFFSMQRS